MLEEELAQDGLDDQVVAEVDQVLREVDHHLGVFPRLRWRPTHLKLLHAPSRNRPSLPLVEQVA